MLVEMPEDAVDNGGVFDAGDDLEIAATGVAWTREFFLADDKVGGSLVATLRAYANADMNVLKTAERLTVHPNTIYSRLQKILNITDLEAKSYHALTELLIVADCRRRSFEGRQSAV